MNPIYTQLVPELINPLKFVTGSAHPSGAWGQGGRGPGPGARAEVGTPGPGRGELHFQGVFILGKRGLVTITGPDIQNLIFF